MNLLHVTDKQQKESERKNKQETKLMKQKQEINFKTCFEIKQ